MDFGAIRSALKAAIATVQGLNVDDLRDNPIAPCAIVVPDTPFNLQLTFDDNENPQFLVLLLVSYNDTGQAQSQMDAYLGTNGDSPSSVIDAIEDDDTLGGMVGGLDVRELRSYGVMRLSDGGTQYLAAELVVRVYV